MRDIKVSKSVCGCESRIVGLMGTLSEIRSEACGIVQLLLSSLTLGSRPRRGAMKERFVRWMTVVVGVAPTASLVVGGFAVLFGIFGGGSSGGG